ncbi:response regulator transcription factor [Methylobacterium pseudosasicola]|uniref:Two component transcriptional regulator, LuxR family n=1 Tax=Methylobacterium pseudosasicola TaxID=582667 RepID=A0A1I4RVD6_9HYPH|nr:response regulator [Methylobacterium pseudosasicola]SFM56205.1 two component transcriptional regulator, LuxR family [Methylobacterium pseudosasicola]
MKTASISTIHVVDDDEAMRHSLALLLGVFGHRVVEHAGAATLLEESSRLNGCIVADLRMPHIDGLEMLGRLRAAGSMMPVVIMTGHADVPTAVRAMKLGACDVLEKPFEAPLLLDAVRAALVGDDGAQPTSDDADFAEQVSRLTGRERDVLHHVLLGRTNKEIGQVLDISYRTVEIHRAKVMTKTGCGCVQTLVRRAARMSMI